MWKRIERWSVWAFFCLFVSLPLRIVCLRYPPLARFVPGHQSQNSKTKLKAGKVALSERASKALDEANGDINYATQLLYSRDDVADARVKTWNAIAEFLPLSESQKLPERTEKRLQKIANACTLGNYGRKVGSLLDVGCGNGLMLPYLKKSGLKLQTYTGVDISPVMIDQLSKKKAKGVCEDFATWHPEDFYDTILLNAVLQYTSDPLHVVRKAASIGKSIVIAHYQGRKFIRDEMRTMGEDKIKDMPSREEVIATVGNDWVIDEKISRNEHELDEFYLMKLSMK